VYVFRRLNVCHKEKNFILGDKFTIIDNAVQSWPHIGHIITNDMDDILKQYR